MVIPAVCILVLDITLYLLFISGHSEVDNLNLKPRADAVYVLGNSMFKTGIDFELLSNILPEGERTDFEYHNGYYSNLWYLILKKAIIPAKEHPKMIVWGFRPTYAIYPAFRQNKTGDIEKLYDGSDTYYEAKISQQRLSKKEMFNLWLENHSFLYGKRMVIKDKITAFINHYGLYFLKSFISDIRMRELEDNFV